MTSRRTLAGNVRVFTYPWFPENPWQKIVYSAFEEAGGEVVPLENLDRLQKATRLTPRHEKRPVLHLNWTGPITQNAEDVVGSMRAVRDALSTIDDFQASGGRLIWSIHNTLPHEVRFLLPELALCRGLADRADAIVVMNPLTVASVNDLYPLDIDKVTRIEHPSYVGMFPNDIDRLAARQKLALPENATVSTFVGVLRPYKGVEQLIEAFEVLVSYDHTQRLLVGGQPGPGFDDAAITRILRPRENVTVYSERVPDDELQYWMTAADVVALPYLSGLNVSVALLAASFGIPVALRRLPDLAYLDGEEWVTWIEGSGNDLARSLMEAQQTLRSRPGAGAAAQQYAADRSPDQIARQYHTLFLDVTEGR